METEPAPQAPPGWYPDFWTPSRKRYWTGSSWTFATIDAAGVDEPPPLDASPLPAGHGLPAPVVRRPDGPATSAPPAKKKRPWLWGVAVVVGLIIGVIGVVMSGGSSSDNDRSDTATPVPSSSPRPSTTPTSALPPAVGNDPSAAALESLIVKPEDVPTNADVVVFPGGLGLNQPTMDLCNGRYPSESRRTARIQDAVLDAQGALVLSTEAVLYRDSGGTTQALDEVKAVVAACPAAPVQGTTGDPVTTRFVAAPDATWRQTATVNRLAYDFTTTEGTTAPRRTIAVYLQRGRVLLGVYFSKVDGPQLPVEGQTTIEGIVGVFAARLAALPTSVVGA
ncbi:MAG TPA: hypothetical protein VJ653_00510 [Acidimicrobiales bacterium]|nr:hypothetical protein [Acidimicrobiales bacterium]